MMEALFDIFGEDLPPAEIFYATRGALSPRAIKKAFGSFENFENDYAEFCANYYEEL